ncbi:GIN domain-containing protein [Fulvivirga aurantia]|uniref:GIN domain-containing protein n=1 Tax=Fulvivirga aurantia TaxID=2529383 RepID=UPI0016286FE6|nr:DUF2807 domain-containing protein [Fulvivirga aurantia]
MKTSFFLFLFLVVCPAMAQQSTLMPFSKLIISPKIEVVLKKGDKEQINWQSIGVAEDRVHLNVKNNTLHVYLEEAKITTRYQKDSFGKKYPMYGDDVLVKAVITYVDLERIEIRGEEKITVLGEMEIENKFVLKAYGATDILFDGVKSEKSKFVLIGENKLTCNGGSTKRQKVKLIGENKVFCEKVMSPKSKVSSIGESDIHLFADQQMKISAIGESDFTIYGAPLIRKALMIGENRVIRE